MKADPDAVAPALRSQNQPPCPEARPRPLLECAERVRSGARGMRASRCAAACDQGPMFALWAACERSTLEGQLSPRPSPEAREIPTRSVPMKTFGVRRYGSLFEHLRIALCAAVLSTLGAVRAAAQ